MSLTQPHQPLREAQLNRRIWAVTNRLLVAAGLPPRRSGWSGSLYPADPVARRFWLSSRSSGYRLYVEVADDGPSTLPSPSARRAADLLRAVRAALS